MKVQLRTEVLLLALIVVFGGGYFVGYKAHHAHSAQKFVQKFESSADGTPYKFINPLLFCQDQNLDNETLNTMETSVKDYIAQEQGNGELIDASFYFRDLNGGPWSLINPDFKTLPASLLKVPLAISVYQHAEKTPNFLDSKAVFSGGADSNKSEHFPPPEKIQTGTTYRVQDLLGFMLQDSDNNAMFLLGSMVPPQELKDSYKRLGITAPTENGYTIDVKTYSSFFRILFNGTYLTQEDSESLLSTLSKSTFTQGIVAGVPKGTVVAHKFGEANPTDGTVRLNDCGIVYKPDQPYLLCVMTKGTNFDTLAKIISTISQKVYSSLEDQAN